MSKWRSSADGHGEDRMDVIELVRIRLAAVGSSLRLEPKDAFGAATSTIPRMVVLGDACTGKSACVLRYIAHIYTYEYAPTIEDVYRRVLTVLTPMGMASILLEIQDYAGRGDYLAVPPVELLARREVCMVCYRCDDRSSWLFAQQIIKSVYRAVKDIPVEHRGVVALVETMNDREASRVITRGEAKAFASAQPMQVRWYTTSALIDDGVTQMFDDLMLNMFLRLFHAAHPPAPQPRPSKDLRCCTML